MYTSTLLTSNATILVAPFCYYLFLIELVEYAPLRKSTFSKGGHEQGVGYASISTGEM
jgi:hypothetical protein